MEHIWSNTTNFLNHISNFLPWRGRESLTPLELARIVVSHLEMKYPNIFRSRDTVIYDAYCGWGTLLYACYEKLKEHHTDEYIFRNMLYGNEIEKFQYRILLEKLPDYGVTNITNHDSLKTEFPMKPTVIIFNPPYNTSGGANNIKDWNRHCQHQIEVNKPDYLVPIIPNQAVSNKGINGESLRNTLKMNGYGWIDAINQLFPDHDLERSENFFSEAHLTLSNQNQIKRKNYVVSVLNRIKSLLNSDQLKKIGPLIADIVEADGIVMTSEMEIVHLSEEILGLKINVKDD